MFIYIWFQITFSVTYNPSVWRAVMMPNVDNMLSIGYLGSYSFTGLKQDEIKPEDQPSSSNDWEKREWSIELCLFFFYGRRTMKVFYNFLFLINEMLHFVLMFICIFYFLYMLTQWCHRCQCIRSNTKI